MKLREKDHLPSQSDPVFRNMTTEQYVDMLYLNIETVRGRGSPKIGFNKKDKEEGIKIAAFETT